MPRSTIRSATLLALLATTAACKQDQGTEIVFEIQSAYRVPDEVDSVRIEVVGLGANDDPTMGQGCSESTQMLVGPGSDVERFPFTFGVRQGERCDHRVLFTVRLLKLGATVVSTSATAAFQAGQSRRVVVAIPSGAMCGPDELWCGAGCTDPNFDNANCRACGNACGGDSECVSGWCRCGGGRQQCGDACVDVWSDPANCGGCGNACGPSEYCVTGSCTGGCPMGQTDCGGYCADLMWDPFNCGGCGSDCGRGGSCNMGSCTVCSAPLGGSCTLGGDCPCPEGSRCDPVFGPYDYGPERCTPAGFAGPGDACLYGTECAPGLGCSTGSSVPVGGGGEPDPLPPAMEGFCVPWCLREDPEACGGQPHRCAALAGQPTYGYCLPDGLPEQCNGIDDDLNNAVDDVNTLGDPANCGGCGLACDEWTPVCSCGSCMAPGDGIVGAPCLGDMECMAAGCGSTCISDIRGIAFPDGYCSSECDPMFPSCPQGSACIGLELPMVGFVGRCATLCRTGGSECRPGYDCVVGPDPGDLGVCFPAGLFSP